MAFADKVEIQIVAGRGGNGKVSFHHDKFSVKGGPDGGDGGNGGDIVILADHNTSTLSYYRTNRRVVATDGGAGGNGKKHGKSGDDAIVRVPPGTVVYQQRPGLERTNLPSPRPGLERTMGLSSQRPGLERTMDLRPGLVLADLTKDGDTAVIASGGKGGFGNAHFTGSTRQRPEIAELGEPGEEKSVIFELKLVADIGLVGLPNAGKSTLLSVISNAKPAIADYPFTTLIPNLGVVDLDGQSILVADIPGLIEGASQGKGLGDEFLRHIERTAVIFHLIDATSTDPIKDYQTVQTELADYQTDLSQKPQLIVLTKTDAISPADITRITKSFKTTLKQPVFFISAAAHQGVKELLRAALGLVATARATVVEEVTEDLPVIDESSMPNLWQVTKTDTGYSVSGKNIERFAVRTNFDNPASVGRLRDILRKTGVQKALVKAGAKEGDTITIGQSELIL